MIEGIAELKSVLDKHKLPLKKVEYSKMFTELFSVFDSLINDDSYYSQVMRQFSSHLKLGIFFDSSAQDSLSDLVTLSKNPDFKTAIYGNFGKMYKPSYLDTLISVFEIYRADMGKMEKEISFLTKEIQSRPF